MRIKAVFLILAALFFTSVLSAQKGQGPPSPAQAQPQTPGMPQGDTGSQNPSQTREKPKSQAQGPVAMTEKEVTKEIKSGPAEKVIQDVKQRGVDFDMTPEIEKRLRKAKATDEQVEAVKQAGPKARAQAAKLALATAQAGPQGVPKEQGQAYDAIRGELDPDKCIALSNDFAKKYPDSTRLSYVYSFEANAYQQKGDVDKVVELTQESLKLKPDNIMSLVMMVGMMPQPQYLKNHEADRDKILQQAESEGNRALQLLATIPKQANETDADHQKRVAEISSQVHASLGMVHLERATEPLSGVDKAELAKAEQEFTTAVTMTDHGNPQDYYRLGEAYSMDGKLNEALQAFTNASQAGQGTMLKAYADKRIADLKKRMGQSAAAPSPQ
jgi:tetratricopeptide (TPR) repeat protein